MARLAGRVWKGIRAWSQSVSLFPRVCLASRWCGARGRRASARADLYEWHSVLVLVTGRFNPD